MHLVRNNVDYGPLLYGTALALIALIILSTVLIRRKIRLTWREEMIAALYNEVEPGSNSDYYKNWRSKYIEVVEKKFGTSIWRKAYKLKTIPPVSEVFAPTH